MTDIQIQKKIASMTDILIALLDYKPSYIGNKEAMKLRTWAKIMAEDAHLITEHYIHNGQSHEQ